MPSLLIKKLESLLARNLHFSMAADEHRDIDGNDYRLHNLEYIVFLKATKGNETLIESFISNGNSTNFKNLNRSTQLLRKIIDVVKEG